MRPWDEQTLLIEYLFRYHGQLIPVGAQRLLLALEHGKRVPEHLVAVWLRYVPLGLRAALEDCAERVDGATAREVLGDWLLSESADKVVIHRCPRCGGIARTPTARQCRWCGHDWHQDGDR